MPDETDDGAPEEEEQDEFGPGDPDYDLSEAHGYRPEPPRDPRSVPPWLLAAVSIALVIGLLLPALIIIFR